MRRRGSWLMAGPGLCRVQDRTRADPEYPHRSALSIPAPGQAINASARRFLSAGLDLPLGLGLTDRAAVAATQAPMSNTRAVEISAAILSQPATSAYGAARYVEAL